VDAEFAGQHVEGKPLRLASPVGNYALGFGDDTRRNKHLMHRFADVNTFRQTPAA
jgi:hypothetical protein